MKIWVLMISLLMLLGCTTSPKQPISQTTSKPPYAWQNAWCGTLRGNGQRMPAHLASLARLTEFYGPPAALVGGSSSSITMLLAESILMNPYFSKDYFEKTAPEDYHEDVAFLFKSTEGYLVSLESIRLVKAVTLLIEQQKAAMEKVEALKPKFEEGGWRNYLSIVKAALLDKHVIAMRQIVFSEEFGMLVNTDFFLKYINTSKAKTENWAQQVAEAKNEEEREALTREFEKVMAFRQQQLKTALGNIGKFDASKDTNLFFRPSLIRSEGLAALLGRMADFYAGYGFKDYWTRRYFRSLMKTCTRGTRGKTWRQIVDQNPQCQELLAGAVSSWRNFRRENQGMLPRRVNDPISSEKIRRRFRAFPVTALLVGDSARKFIQMQEAFKSTTDPAFGDQFLADRSDFRIGYWGVEADLAKIERNLSDPDFVDVNGVPRDFTTDARSQAFFPIGEDTWMTIVSRSTAEPGQGPLKPLSDDNPGIISAGGWPNHNGAMVLNALGCTNIIQITRRDGVSNFGQTVAKRLFGLDGFEMTFPDRHISQTGLAGDMASDWSRLYNLRNPQSSFNRAIYVSDGIWCTDWDRYAVEKGEMQELVDDAYNAEFYIPDPPWRPGRRQVSPFITNGFRGAAAGYDNVVNTLARDKANRQGEGFSEYAGCIPLVDPN